MVHTTSLCSYIFLVVGDPELLLTFGKKSSAHVLGGVSGVASFITTDKLMLKQLFKSKVGYDNFLNTFILKL